MPLDEIIEEIPMENQENITDNPTDNSIDITDTEIGDNNSLVQEENGSQDTGTDSVIGEDVPDSSPSTEEEILETDNGNVSFGEDTEMGFDEIENQMPDYTYYGLNQEVTPYSTENVEVYTDLDAFESSSVQVDLYQYTILNRLEFIQYALCIVIALLFLQIFVRYKR